MTDNDWELITRFLAGELSAEEQDQFERWLAEAPARGRMVNLAREIAASSDDVGDPGRRTEILTALRRHVQKAPPTRTFAIGRASRQAVALRWAAAVLLAMGAGVAGTYLVRRHRVSSEQNVALRTTSTPAGQRAVIRLPDSTRVMLGPASTLEYRADLGGHSRAVVLRGEAYFEVVHDERRPFSVRAGDVVAQDLGTEFTVRAYPEDPHTRIVVQQGRVAFRVARGATPADTRTLGPGQLGRIGADGAPRVEQVDASRYLAWTEGFLVFDKTPLRDALPELNRWYDLEFRLADDRLGAIPLSGTFKERLTNEELNILAASLGLHQVRRGRVITFYRGGSPS